MADTTEIDIVISSNLRRLIGNEYGAQISVARKVGLTPGGLNRIVKGKAHAGPKVVADLANALGVSEVSLYQDPSVEAPKSNEPTLSDVVALLQAFQRATPDARAAAVSLLDSHALNAQFQQAPDAEAE